MLSSGYGLEAVTRRGAIEASGERSHEQGEVVRTVPDEEPKQQAYPYIQRQIRVPLAQTRLSRVQVCGSHEVISFAIEPNFQIEAEGNAVTEEIEREQRLRVLLVLSSAESAGVDPREAGDNADPVSRRRDGFDLVVCEASQLHRCDSGVTKNVVHVKAPSGAELELEISFYGFGSSAHDVVENSA